MVDVGWKSMEFRQCRCGIIFGAPKGFFNTRRTDRRPFYCPNGCSNIFFQQSDLGRENIRLKQQLKNANVVRDHWKKEALTAKRSCASYKAHFHRLKNKMEGDQDE